jgi:hypothetical protein
MVALDNISSVIGLDKYALQLQDVDPSLFNGQTFAINLGSVEDAIGHNGAIEDGLLISEKVMELFQNSTASVQLPSNFLGSTAECAMDMRPRLSHSVFLTDVLFQSPQTRSRDVGIGSIIVTVRLSCVQNSSTNPFRVTFRTVEQVMIT